MDFDTIKKMTDDSYVDTFSRFPVAFVEGKGMTVTDSNGKTYKDFLAGIAVNALGYSDDQTVAAIQKQAARVLHISNLFYNDKQAELSDALVQATGYHSVFLSNSGAEANEAAFKLVRKYFNDRAENRYEVITAHNSFHGRTFATMTLTGQSKYSAPYAPLPTGIAYGEFNNFDSFKRLVNKQTAAIMLETVQGEGGVFPATQEFMLQIGKLCKENGLLLIIDEVQTGMGRCGTLLSCSQYDIQPDIVTLAKALGGGLPLGATLVSKKLADVFTPGSHGTTFGGNPLACTAGLVVLNRLTGGLIDASAKTAQYFRKKLETLGNPRGLGMLLGLPLPESVDGKKVVAEMLEKGFIINCAGQNTLRFAPPLIVKEKDIDEMILALKGVINDKQL